MTKFTCIAVVTWMAFAGSVIAQSTAAPAADAVADRGARIAERYRTMLDANPVEGMALDRLWKYHEDHGSVADLLDGYRQAADAPGANASPTLIYGYLLKKAGRLEEAVTSFQQASERAPSNPLPKVALADVAALQGNSAQAATLYGDALRFTKDGDHGKAELLLKQGRAYLAAGQAEQAADTWEKTVAINPADIAVRRQLAETYENNGLPERAMAHYEYIEAHAGPAERATAARELGRLHESSGNFDAARDALERGIALTARDNWLHGDLETRLIRLYQRAGRVPELAARWREAAGQAPRDLAGYYRLAALARAEGDAAGDRAALEKIQSLSPNDRENNLRLAARLVEGGEIDRAAALYDAVLKTQPSNLDVLTARADLDVQQGKLAVATSRMEEGLARSSADESVATAALNFFLAHHLDEAAERVLRAGVLRAPTATEPALAVAKFLFARRRGPEGASVLEALLKGPGDDAAAGSRLAQVADVYREGGLPADAVRCLQRATALRPDDPNPRLATAEIQRAAGDVPGAVNTLRQTLSVVPAGPDRINVERKLFEVLSSGEKPPENTAPVTNAPQPRGAVSPMLAGYLAELAADARREPTVENYLRLGRWCSWSHDGQGALAAANAALTLDAESFPALELLAATATELQQNDLAEKTWYRILALDPAREGTVLRQLARLKLQAGNNEDALKVYARLAELDPGSRAALSDLALAQQRSDRWFDALATWERAYALPGATPAQRADLRRTLLAACDHVGKYARAVDVLLGGVDEQTDSAAREDLYRQMADVAYKHGLGQALRVKFEERLRRKPDDFLTLTALAQFCREEGDREGAYRLLKRAQYSAPEPARYLAALVREGDELGEIDDAVSNQSRLLAQPGEFTSENLQRLAALQEESQDADAAARTWNTVVARYPRDPATLGQASQYFERANQLSRARELRRQVVALNPGDPQIVMQLATLDAALGDTEAALRDYDTVLERTQAEAPGEALAPPDELTLPETPLVAAYAGIARARLRGPEIMAVPVPSATAKAPAGDRLLRLQAIRESSRLRFPPDGGRADTGGAANAAWLARWQKAADEGVRSEPFHAFYFSGQGKDALALLTKWLQKGEGDTPTVRHAFLAAGLRFGDYAAVERWVWIGGDSRERDGRVTGLIAALDQFLGTGGKPGAGMVEGLFPPGVERDDLLWDMAREFAALHWYGPASQIGQRLLAHRPGERIAHLAECVEWQLYEGSGDAARHTASYALESGGGWSLEPNVSPVFAALREYYLLLPEVERAAFAAAYLERMRARGEKFHTLLAGVLLHGMAGAHELARHELDALLAARIMAGESNASSADGRRWVYLLSNGVQLQNWGLDAEAAYLWRQAMASATAFDDHFGDGETAVAEIRRRLLCAEVILAPDPEEAREYVEDYLRTSPAAGAAANLAGLLVSKSCLAAATQIYEYVCRAEPANAENWRSLFSVYEKMGDWDRCEQRFETLLAGAQPLPEGLSRPDLVCRWASVRERNGDPAGACQVLQAERKLAPATMPVLIQLARTYERMGQDESAVAVWREVLPLSNAPTANLALADALERLGRRDEAIRLLEGALSFAAENGQNEIAARLSALYFAAGRVDEAHTLARTLVRQGKLEYLPNVAAGLAAAGRVDAAREILSAACWRTRDPGARFRLRQALVELSPASGATRREFLRGMARLETDVRETPALRGNWEAIRYKVARQAGADDWLETELRRLWKAGKGDYLAGERLATLCIETHQPDRLRETIGEFDRRPLLPDQLLFGLESALVRADQAPLALPISERLCRRFPQNADFALSRATVLWKSDQREAANHVLDALENQSVLRDGVSERIALLYLGLGDKQRAMRCFERTVGRDPLAVRSPENFLQLARLYLEAGRTQDAAALLRVAYRQDACDDFRPLVEFLAASGQLEGDKILEMPAADFPLSFGRRAALLATIAEYLKQKNRDADAWKLWTHHAGFLAGAAAAAAELAHSATPAQMPELRECLRTAINESAAPVPRLKRALAEVEAHLDSQNRAATNPREGEPTISNR